LDTMIHLPLVEIRAKTIFDKQYAGLKETHIDSALLKEKAGQSVSQLLSENTTVYVYDYGRGALSTASFRGTAVSHTQVSWNGLSVNSPMSGIVDFSLIPLFTVDELNLQHGASSIAYSSGGLGGHVDMKNQPDWKKGVRGRYYQGIGSYKSFDEYARLNLGNSRIQSSTRLYRSSSENDYPYINTSLTDKPELRMDGGDYVKMGVMQEVYARPSAESGLAARLWYQDAERSIPTVMSYEGMDTSLHRTNLQADRTLKAVIEGNLAGKKTFLIWSAGIDYQQLDYFMKIQISGMDENMPVNSASDMLGIYNKMELDYTFSGQLRSNLKVNYNYYTITTLDSANNTGFQAYRHEFTSYGGLYASLSDWLILSLGLRKDVITGLKTPLIYSIGASFKPLSKEELVIKTSFSRNYHNPSLNHLYWQPGGNPDLLPEEGYSADAGIQYLIRRGNLQLESQLTAYYSRINNWILWLPGFKGYWEAMNIRRVKSYGIELQTQAEWLIGKNTLKLIGNYLFSRSLNQGDPLVAGDDSYGMQLPFIPVHSGNVLLHAGRKGYYIKYQYQYTGIRHLLSSNRMGIIDDSEYFGSESPENPFFRLYAQHLNHLTLGKNFYMQKCSLGVEFRVNNLFNEVYRNILNRYMPRRHYMVMVKFDF
ncbi:MAG: TonB-dependent receptor, partial [Bacteroidales bacterium]|nr:TonB-dependent receptor [Bacteroidales bacterium]